MEKAAIEIMFLYFPMDVIMLTIFDFDGVEIGVLS